MWYFLGPKCWAAFHLCINAVLQSCLISFCFTIEKFTNYIDLKPTNALQHVRSMFCLFLRLTFIIMFEICPWPFLDVNLHRFLLCYRSALHHSFIWWAMSDILTSLYFSLCKILFYAIVPLFKKVYFCYMILWRSCVFKG